MSKSKLKFNVLSIGEWIKLRGKYLHEFTCKGCHKNSGCLRSGKTVAISGYCVKCANIIKFSKPIRLKFYNKHKIWKYNSLTDFCKPRIATLGRNARFHFAEVLSGKRLHYKGWINADNKVLIDLSLVKKIEQTLIKRAVIK